MSILDKAKKLIGSPYEPNIKNTNGEQINYSLHFIQEIMFELGVKIPNTIEEQYKKGQEVINKKDMILGDCVYFDNNEGINNVGLYIGNNKIIYPSLIDGKRKIIEKNINNENIKNIRRFLSKYETGKFILHIRTPFKYVDKISQFVLSDYNGNGIMDLFCFKNEKEKTEVHVLNGENNFKSFLFEYKTALHNFDNSFEFKIGNFKNPIPDIYCIKKNKTGSQSTEIHILSGKELYESYLNNFKTALEETDDNWTFGIGEYNQNFDRYNIYCIKKRTKSKKIEIKILNC